MMIDHLNRKGIRGNSAIMISSGALLVLFFCFMISIVIMGTGFRQLFLALLVLTLPVVLVGIVVIRMINWFEFDDEKRKIIRALWRSFSYDVVKTIHVKERWGRSSISIRTGWLRKRWLADGLNKDEASRAEQELAHRFPSAAIYRKKYSNGMLATVAIVFLLLTSAACAGFVYYSYTVEPHLFLIPEKKDWLGAGQPKTGVHYTVNGFDFVLPLQFQLLQASGTWRYFEDISSKTKLSAGPGIYNDIFRRGKAAVRYLTGVEDSYDLFRLAYREKFGTLPTAMKIISFNRMSDVSLFELERDSLRGFVLQGKKEGNAFAEIEVTDKASGKEIQFFMQEPGALKEKMLRSIVGSIRVEGEVSGKR